MIQWFVQTAGVSQDQGYRWLALDGSRGEAWAKELVYGNLAGRPLLDMVSERTPSLVLGRRPDRSYLLFANGLRPPGAPAKGDYQGRPIRAVLLGYAPTGTDATALLDAAGAVLAGTLAAMLPLTWDADGPRLDAAAARWAPAALERRDGDAGGE